MKTTLSTIGKCFLLLLAGCLIGSVLLTAAYYIPVNEELAQISMNLHDSEGEYPLANVIHSQGSTFFTSFKPVVLDNVTDGLILKNVLNNSQEKPWMTAMDMNNYPRYWHGYVVLLRPLFYFFSYDDIRVLNCFAQILLTFFTALAIWNHTQQKRYVLAFLTSYALLMPLALPLSLQYTWVFYLAFGGSLFAMCKKDFLLRNSRYIYLFFILGMLTSYLDLLTFPLLTWGFPILWWLTVSKDSMDAKERLKKIILSGISWVVGYGVFWFLKWVIASFFLGYNVISESMNEIFYRVGEVDEYAKGLLQAYDRWEVFYTNWRHYEYGIYSIILVLWIFWAIFHSIKEGWQPKLKSLPLLLVACSSIVWYAVLSNHTTIHHFFTYRIYGVSILAFLIFILECIPPRKIKVKKHSLKECLLTLTAWAIFGIISLPLTTLAKEDITAIYGIEYQELTLREGSTLTTTFIPTFSNVRDIGFCVQSTEEQGYYTITVLREGQELYQLDVPLASHKNSAYYNESVDWKLSARQEYQLQFTLSGADSCNILITHPGNMPLNEYRNLSLDATTLEGQPLGGITYHTRVQSRLRLAYAALMWMAVFGAVSTSIKTIVLSRKSLSK